MLPLKKTKNQQLFSVHFHSKTVTDLSKVNHRQLCTQCLQPIVIVMRLLNAFCKSQYYVQPFDIIHRFHFLGHHPSNLLEKMAG